MKQATLTIDAGGTVFKSALVDANGQIPEDSFLLTPVNSAGTKEEILASYRQVIRQSLQYAAEHDTVISGLGIATPGPFDYGRGASMMTHKFQSIRDLPLREHFYGQDLLPANTPVVFQQDVHAFLRGEYWHGAVAGVENAAAITLGTGLGFAIMEDGEVLENERGGPFRDIYDLPYEGGILEERVSRRGIAAAYEGVAGPLAPNEDVREIALKAQRGDNVAAKVFSETGRILADEIREILAEHAIATVVFGGQISRSFELFGRAFQETLADQGYAIEAFPAANIENSALLGAAWGVQLEG